MSDQIIVSIVGGGFSILVAMLHLIDKRNTRDHHENGRKLDRIEKKIDTHIADHARRTFD